MIALLILLPIASGIVCYMAGAIFTRAKIASVFDRTFTCHACGLQVDRAVSLSRCSDCHEEYVGPAIADEIRDDCFFES